MPDREAQRERVRHLLAQDPNINDCQLKEFRMTLETNLAAWEDRSEKVRRRLVWSIIILMFGYLGTILSMLSYSPGRAALAGTTLTLVYGAIHWALVIAALVALFAAIWLAITYFVKYAPTLKRARFDVQTSMILQLQEQIAELRADLQRRDKP